MTLALTRFRDDNGCVPPVKPKFIVATLNCIGNINLFLNYIIWSELVLIAFIIYAINYT